MIKPPGKPGIETHLFFYHQKGHLWLQRATRLLPSPTSKASEAEPGPLVERAHGSSHGDFDQVLGPWTGWTGFLRYKPSA